MLSRIVRHLSLLRVVVGCGVVILSLFSGARAQACLVASQDVRVLLGEAKEGLVWAVLVLNRREDDKDERSFWWRLKGHVELSLYDGSSARVLPAFSALSEAFKNPGGRMGTYEPPIRKYLDALAGRIRLPGFRRPKALRQYDCDYARACGPWRLEAAGQSLMAKGGEERGTV